MEIEGDVEADDECWLYDLNPVLVNLRWSLPCHFFHPAIPLLTQAPVVEICPFSDGRRTYLGILLRAGLILTPNQTLQPLTEGTEGVHVICILTQIFF